MNLAYKKIADITVSADTTQIDISGFSYDKENLLMLVSDIENNGLLTDYGIFANEDTVTSNYYEQWELGRSTSLSSGRENNSDFLTADAGTKSFSIMLFKVTENGTFVWQSETKRKSGSSVDQERFHGSKIASISTLTSLSIISSDISNGIGAGSRFKLYSLIAEPIADITVSADTTQVDISNINFDETNELLLIADVNNSSGLTSNYSIYVNGDTTETNYYVQEKKAVDTAVTSIKNNNAVFGAIDNTKNMLSLIKIKPTFDNYFIFQAETTQNVGEIDVSLKKSYGAKLATISGVTSLSMISSTADAIGTGSRFKLYKLK